MRYSPIIAVFALFSLAGCGSGSSVGDIVEEQLEEQVTETISSEIEGAQDSLLLRFSGATFVAVGVDDANVDAPSGICLLYTSPSPRDATLSRMPSSA